MYMQLLFTLFLSLIVFVALVVSTVFVVLVVFIVFVALVVSIVFVALVVAAAFIYAFGVFGPIMGFALGALMLQYYVDLFTFDSGVLKLSVSHPRWVGAWWGGFIFLGGLIFLVSIPFYGFPKMLLKALRQVVREEPGRMDAMICWLKSKAYSGDTTDDGRTSLSKNIRGTYTWMCSVLGYTRQVHTWYVLRYARISAKTYAVVYVRNHTWYVRVYTRYVQEYYVVYVPF
jgi:hypothetical protein